MITKISSKTQVQVLKLSDAKEWRNYLALMPENLQDVYLTPEYYSLYEQPAVKAECFVYQRDEEIVVYPYLRTDIKKLTKLSLPKSVFDIEGAYGYNGFVSNSVDSEFLKNFEEEFHEYCVKENIIAEFIRFNPVFHNDEFALTMTKEVKNKNVIVDLTQSEEELWMGSYEHSVRKNVKKAERNLVVIKFWRGHEITTENLGKFIEVYQKTMDRNNADKMYYFSEDYFKRLPKMLSQDALFVFAMLEDKVVSCEVVLLSPRIAYSFLGGTLAEHYTIGANNLLKHKLILKLKELGIAQYCIGGGRTMGDDIFRYKQNFAKNGIVDFYIGKKIHSLLGYADVCQVWDKTYPDKKEQFKNYFLKYKC